MTILSVAVSAADNDNNMQSLPPRCFYCAMPDNHWWPIGPVKKDLSKLSYMGLRVNVPDECDNICANKSELVPLQSQMDCFKAASNLRNEDEVYLWAEQHRVHYIHDPANDICYSFDPRDEDKTSLYQFLPSVSELSNVTKKEIKFARRDLQQNNCSLNTDCFSCGLSTAFICKWANNKCESDPQGVLQKYWFHAIDTCPDNLKMCSQTNANSSHFEFQMFNNNPVASTAENYVPKNYYCHFKMKLD